jgi:hypothetical protein
MSQSVNLVLKTTQISSDNTVANYYGLSVKNNNGSYITNYRTSFQWTNINMKTLLGDMFEKFERFNICLNFVAGAATGGVADNTVNIDNRNLQVKLSGLPFTSSYNQPTLNNNNSVVMTVVTIPSTAVTTWVNNYFTVQYYTFTKQSIVNLSIDLHTVQGDTNPIPDALTKMIGHCIFSFNIYGVEKFENKNITSSRLL